MVCICGCLGLARWECGRKLLGLGLVLSEVSRYRESTGLKIKKPSVERMAGSHEGVWVRIFGETLRSRDKKMSHQNAIREGPEIRPALNAAHGGGFRSCENVRMSLIQNGRGERI